MNLSLIKSKKLIQIESKSDTSTILIKYIYRLNNKYCKRRKARETRNNLLVIRLRISNYLSLLRYLLRLLLMLRDSRKLLTK